jgi:hypothetical protein
LKSKISPCGQVIARANFEIEIINIRLRSSHKNYEILLLIFNPEMASRGENIIKEE